MTATGIFETAGKYVGEGAKIIGNGISRFAGNPVVRENVEKASKIATEVGDMAKKGFDTVVDSKLGKKAAEFATAAAPIAGAAAPIVNDLVSNFVNKPQNSNPHATNLDEGKNPPTDSKSEGQTVNLGDLPSQEEVEKKQQLHKELGEKFNQLKRKNDETSSAESQDNTQANPQDAQASDSKDGEGFETVTDGKRPAKRPRVMTPQDHAHEEIRKQQEFDRKDTELADEINAHTIKQCQNIIENRGGVPSLYQSLNASNQQLCATGKEGGASPTSQTPQSSQYPQPQAQPYQNTSGNAVYDNKFSSNSDLDEDQDQDQTQNILNSNNPKKRSASNFFNT